MHGWVAYQRDTKHLLNSIKQYIYIYVIIMVMFNGGGAIVFLLILSAAFASVCSQIESHPTIVQSFESLCVSVCSLIDHSMSMYVLCVCVMCHRWHDMAGALTFKVRP
jgi:hypothetical protein